MQTLNIFTSKRAAPAKVEHDASPSDNLSMGSEDPGPKSIVTDDAIVHFVYDVANPPPRPSTSSQGGADSNESSQGGETWTRFICISDTHCNTFDVPDGDVLLHAGDLTHTGRFKQLKPTVQWLKSLPHPHKIIIAGNHDLALDRDWYLEHGKGWHHLGLEDPDTVRGLMDADEGDETFHYLRYESMEIEQGGRKWNVYGSPGSPWFGGWAFNYDREEEAPALVDAIPNDVDILLTHGPPHRILDMTNTGVYAGCQALKARLGKGLRPAIHIFGHIHEARGAIVHQWPEDTESNDGPRRRSTVFVNAATQITPQHRSMLRKGTDGYHYPAIIVDIKTPRT